MREGFERGGDRDEEVGGCGRWGEGGRYRGGCGGGEGMGNRMGIVIVNFLVIPRFWGH